MTRPQLQTIDIFTPKKEERFFSLLDSFGIKAEYVRVKSKKFFDVYDIKLSPGVRSSRLDRMLVDLGMAIESHAHPVGYPVLKDGVYRIEVQKAELESPTLQSVVRSFDPSSYSPIALGSNHHGEPFSVDLNRIPNLLVGGTTGSGKSVLLHSFILSLLKRDACLYLVDPKTVEFNVYSELDAVKSLVNTVEDASHLIGDVRDLMETRFAYLSKAKVRSAAEYNKRVSPEKRMRPVVIVVDEWADLVLQDKDIQKPLCLVAQKGRAAGVSIILATQRPSCRVISGLVKANFPGRIALKVASAVDSRVILDSNGAEKISDVGTGLYIDGSTHKPALFRAPFIEDVAKELELISPPEKLKRTFWQKFVF
jgi:DNA segregation ATPase FtsK/SpoIIIE, S-DNA-T family